MADTDEEIFRLALARGIFFPTAEIFDDNIAGFWEYGPVGLRILNKLIQSHRDFASVLGGFEVSGSVLLPRIVLEASGHIDNFFDIVVTCKKCGTPFRADKLLAEKDKSRSFEGLKPEEYERMIKEKKIKCKKCGNELGNAEAFNLMLGTTAGNSKEVNAFMRPEACQSIFLDFKRIFETNGSKLPLTVFQTGKAFRNEISPRNNLLRQREFYQSDIEVFFIGDDKFNLSSVSDEKISILDGEKDIGCVSIKEAMERGVITNKVTAYMLAKESAFLNKLGLGHDDIRFRKLYDDKAFYSKEAFDVEIRKGEDWAEITACNHRGDYDLSRYKVKGAKIAEVDGKVPEIFELSSGLDRIFYSLLYKAFKRDEKRRVLELPPAVAPYGVAVFPLLAKRELEEKATEIRDSLYESDDSYYLDTGNIGQMYRKADEIGVPLAVTIDYQTKEDGTVTVRDRDSMKQFRAKSSDIDKIIKEHGKSGFAEVSKKYSASQ